MLRQLWELYILFFRMGAVTFGGGYAMLPILRREIVEKRQWMTEEQIVDYYALSQGLPGVITANVAVFIGRHRCGFWGGVAAALGGVSPCLVIISAIAFFLAGFQDVPLVRHAFAGISVCVVALILDAVLSLWKKTVKSAVGLIAFLSALLVSLFTEVSPVWIVVTGAAAGILLGLGGRRKEAEK